MKWFLSFSIFFMIICCNKNNENKYSYENQLREVNVQVIKEALQQYNISEKSGDLNEIYNAVSLVKEAYKQANDEENYLIWLNKEKEIEKKLGLDF